MVSALVLFDLDGTVVDSRVDLANSTNDMLAGYGMAARPVERIAAMVGEGARKLVERALADAGLQVSVDEALARFRAAYDRRLLEHTRPYPGIETAVRTAARCGAAALLTNKPEDPSRRLLDAFGLLDAFTWIVGGDSGFPRKPDPTSVQHLMTQASASADQTLFVGDSPIDMETARRAGVRLCIARYGFGHLRGDMTPGPLDFIADEPSEVARLIETLFAAGATPLPPRA
jgi:phosphoglycolate phosphatase